jgi:hypothetical protein
MTVNTKNPILSIKSGKIVGKWEGRPTVFQTDYLGSLPIVFPERS